MAQGCLIRRSRVDDLPLLVEIERAAAALFEGHDVAASVLADSTSIEQFRVAHDQELLWVADWDAVPVGFAFVEIVDGCAHLDELDVHPRVGRRGIGSMLVRAVCAWAGGRIPAVLTLTTFRDIPWNEPFYRRLGFEEAPASEIGPELGELLRGEAARGLDPTRRLVMRWRPPRRLCCAPEPAADAVYDLGNQQAAAESCAVVVPPCEETLGDDPIRALRRELIAPPVWRNADELDAYRLHAAAVLDAFAGRDLRLSLAEIQASGAEAPLEWTYHGRDNASLKRKYAATFAPLFAGLPRAVENPGAPPWRVGFVVTPTHEEVFLRCMAGIVDGLDRRRFRPAVIAAGAAFGELRQHLHNRDVDLVPLPQRFDLAVEQIRDAAFAALYFWEVGTDATNYFLPFCRMAPLQVTGWGWPETSGAAELDFHVTSIAVAPPGSERLFTEPLARLPHLPAFQRLPPARPRSRRPERFGLPQGIHLYFCAQNLRKVHFDMDVMLGGILRADPAAVAVFVDDKSPVLGELLRRRWRGALADVADRLVILPRLPPNDYLTLLASSHVVLDTPHFAGSNTAYDAIIAGAPVVTLPGEQPSSRYTAALHESIGVTECTAASPEQYVEIAVRVANDDSLRSDLRQRILAAVPVAFENAHAVRQIENFLTAQLEACAD